MATVIGEDKSLYKQFTCRNCAAIVQYRPCEDVYTGSTDEGTKIKGLDCPRCGAFHRTNP